MLKTACPVSCRKTASDRADDGVRPGNPEGEGLARRDLQDVRQQFVADRDDFVVVPGVDGAVATRDLEGQRIGQAKRSQQFLQMFEGPALLHLVVDRLVRRILRRHILVSDLVGFAFRRRRRRCRQRSVVRTVAAKTAAITPGLRFEGSS